MKIATVPLEAYRQSGDISRKSTTAGDKSADAADKAAQIKTITFPGRASGEAESLKVRQSPSFFESVLTTDEKNELVKHFARFGDAAMSSQIYDPGARVGPSVQTGLNVDFKG